MQGVAHSPKPPKVDGASECWDQSINRVNASTPGRTHRSWNGHLAFQPDGDPNGVTASKNHECEREHAVGIRSLILLGLIHQKPQGIENDQERRTFMKQDGGAQSQSENGRRNQKGDHAEA